MMRPDPDWHVRALAWGVLLGVAAAVAFGWIFLARTFLHG
jgi:hypothetical protein